MPDSGFQRRMLEAILYASSVQDRKLSQADVATKVGKVLKKKQLTAAAVSRHFGGRMPTVPVLAAYAKAMHVDPGWLAFGDASDASAPPLRSAELSSRTDRPGGQKKA